MKKIIFALTVFAAVFTACSKNDNNDTASVSTAAVNSTVTSGNWKITLLSKGGTDKTANFSGFKFTFSSNGSLAGANDLLSVNGTWSTRADAGKIKLTINFSSPSINSFLDLNEDWEVTGRTDTQVTMQHVSGGGGGTDLLTIQKN